MRSRLLLACVACLLGAALPASYAAAQSIQYCAGVCGGSVGAQNVSPNPAVERCFQRCIDGKSPASPTADKGTRQGKKTQ